MTELMLKFSKVLVAFGLMTIFITPNKEIKLSAMFNPERQDLHKSDSNQDSEIAIFCFFNFCFRRTNFQNLKSAFGG